MKLGTIHAKGLSNVNYRAIFPLVALQERGHDVVWTDGEPRMDQLLRCDLVHLHRHAEGKAVRHMERLLRAGVAVTWDNDDDIAAMPDESPQVRRHGRARLERTSAAMTQMALRADLVTTPSEVLAQHYRDAGVRHVEVIGNHLNAEIQRCRRKRHEGMVVGWLAGLEHAVDVEHLRIDDVARRLLDAHPDLRVVTIGVDLKIAHERYERHKLVDFRQLADHLAGFDIGIAPIADIPFNHARSDVKLKEYAAVGTPWLASPVGPYRGLGPRQGGRLVADDQWFDAIDALIRRRRERFQLGLRGKAWARGQMIDRVAGRWEVCFEHAIERADRRARKGGARRPLAHRALARR